eukprot:2550567-Rhodomonas_salina.1
MCRGVDDDVDASGMPAGLQHARQLRALTHEYWCGWQRDGVGPGAGAAAASQGVGHRGAASHQRAEHRGARRRAGSERGGGGRRELRAPPRCPEVCAALAGWVDGWVGVTDSFSLSRSLSAYLWPFPRLCLCPCPCPCPVPVPLSSHEAMRAADAARDHAGLRTPPPLLLLPPRT